MVGLLLVGAVGAVRADDKPEAAPDKPAQAAEAPPAQVETRHAITLGTSRLDYRAIAETISLSDEKGRTTASIYTISYFADTAPAAERPVAFVFNGGPGAASVFLHLGALGPRIMETPDSGAAPEPPVRLADNPSTWLQFTDLVFVDPVGTGFSRATGKGRNPERAFWGVRSDLTSMGSVVRLWLTRHERWASPVYLVGESYGGFRAAALARTLPSDAGVTVSGLVLISPALDTALLHADVSNLLAAAFELPSYAAAAAALGMMPARPDLAAAERFALSDYLVGVARLPGQPAGDPLLARIAGFIGLGEDIVRRERGRVPARVFAREIRRAQGEIVSIYDATVARPARGNPQEDHAGDPVLEPATAAFTTAFDSYAPEALGYRTDLPYRALSREVSQHWNWQEASEGEGGLGLALSSLEAVLLAHPQTRVMVVSGRYDLVTPYLGARWLVDQLSVPPAVRAGIRLHVYEGGHMMYMRARERAALAQDAALLFAAPGAPAP